VFFVHKMWGGAYMYARQLQKMIWAG